MTDRDLNGPRHAGSMSSGEKTSGARVAGGARVEMPAGVEPFVCVVRVRFEDIDGMGHANNARYLTYLEEARLYWARDVLGLDGVKDLGFILAHASIDFLLPARIGDPLRVEMWVPRVGTKSWDFAYRIVHDVTGAVYANALTTQVAFDYGRGMSQPIPSDHREMLQRLQ